MLDNLRGKKVLQERIQALEAQIEMLKSEKQSLIARQASKDETARKAVSQKQIVEEKLNTARIKITTLEHEISTLRKDAAGKMTFRNISSISRKSLDNYIFQISSVRTRDSNLVTVYLRPGDLLSNLDGSNELLARLGSKKAAIIDKINSSTTVAVFYDTNGIVMEVVALYLPVDISSWQLDDKFQTKPINNMMEKKVNLCIIIAHAGESFIGFTSSPESFEVQKIIRSSVKGKHTKGGWSQRRFERLRDEDVQHHAEKVSDALKVLIQEVDDRIDFVMAGGDSRLMHEILKDIDNPMIDKKFDVSVDKNNIKEILREVWSSTRYEL
ncbi:MAG: hypothetical protein KAR85_08310 [Methanosarcinales archaeon]|nr:hypothetical protein [Methanosarcinales archaeon]